MNYQHSSSAARRAGGAPPDRRGWRTVAIAPIRRRRGASRRGLLRGRKGRPDAAVHGFGVRDMAPCGARDRRSLPVGTALVAWRAARRDRGQRTASARRQLLPCRESARAADRQHGGDHRGGTAPAPADRTGCSDGSRRAGRRHARGAWDRHGDQRDRGHRVDACRRCRRWVGRHRVLAHMVAGRHLRRPGRPAPDARMGAGPAGGLAPHPNLGRSRRDRGGDRARRRCRVYRRAHHLRGVPGADLGRVPIRSSGSDAGHRDHGRRGHRGHGPRLWARSRSRRSITRR